MDELKAESSLISTPFLHSVGEGLGPAGPQTVVTGFSLSLPCPVLGLFNLSSVEPASYRDHSLPSQVCKGTKEQIKGRKTIGLCVLDMGARKQ